MNTFYEWNYDVEMVAIAAAAVEAHEDDDDRAEYADRVAASVGSAS